MWNTSSYISCCRDFPSLMIAVQVLVCKYPVSSSLFSMQSQQQNNIGHYWLYRLKWVIFQLSVPVQIKLPQVFTSIGKKHFFVSLHFIYTQLKYPLLLGIFRRFVWKYQSNYVRTNTCFFLFCTRISVFIEKASRNLLLFQYLKKVSED